MQRVSNFSLFLLACIWAVLLVALGLRVYFSQARIEAQLAYTVVAADFVAVEGQATVNQATGAVQTHANVSSHSRLVARNLNVGVDWFDRVEVIFREKPALQSLSLTVKSQAGKPSEPLHSTEQPILYTDQLVSRFDISNLAAEKSVIKEVQLSTPRLIAPYQLQSIHFVPKQYTLLGLLSLLRHDVLSSSNVTQDKPYLLMPGKLILVLYFSVVALIFAGLLFLFKRPVASAWWWVLIALWLILDARYIYEKQQTTWGQRGGNALSTIAVSLPLVNYPLVAEIRPYQAVNRANGGQ